MERISNIPLSKFMARNPVTIRIDQPFSRVEELLRINKIRHLPVVNEKRILCGIITQTDLYRTISPMRSLDGELFYTKDLLDSYILDKAMTRKVITLKAEDTMAAAIDIMVKKRFGCIPVTDQKDYLVGIVTQIDVLKMISKYAGWII